MSELRPEKEAEHEAERINRYLRGLAGLALIALLAGAVFYHFVEKLNWLDAFYFCTITLATVGYGDITPHTPAGKIFTIGYVVVGIGIIGAFANLLLKRNVGRRELKHEARSQGSRSNNSKSESSSKS